MRFQAIRQSSFGIRGESLASAEEMHFRFLAAEVPGQVAQQPET